jgi:hypothetical protein
MLIALEEGVFHHPNLTAGQRKLKCSTKLQCLQLFRSKVRDAVTKQVAQSSNNTNNDKIR